MANKLFITHQPQSNSSKSVTKNTLSRGARLFLDVPYNEKDEAKSLGAKWDSKVKKWYIDSFRKDYVKYAKWILNGTDEAIIATDFIYVIEGQQNCWKCGQPTKVIGLGLGTFIHIYEKNNEVQYEFIEKYMNQGEELHLAWAEKEDDIPPKLLDYLKETYSVKTGYSKTLSSKCFANHCDHCKALQGNWYLFNEPDSPLSSCIDGNELAERISKLRIKKIPIENDLQINWTVAFCSNDFTYFQYGKCEELILSSDPHNKNITYKELYGL